MREQLLQEILQARQRVYSLAEATPLQQLEIGLPFELFIKREDLSPINAYKWRGAFNRMSLLTPEQLEKGVVTASAGNHAQGVALSAKKLGTKAIIYMPLPTPQMKRNAVERLGGDHVEVRLIGDNYDTASTEARKLSEEQGLEYIHAYDDLYVMAGQGTIAEEIVTSGKGPFDVAYIQIGGGGLAASVSSWLKNIYPDIKIVGVEGEDQASMAAAIKAGKPVELDYVDVFCDGTAVKKAGESTYSICKDTIDEFVQVSNEEVSAAIQTLWNCSRVIPEPSGAMGLAGVIKDQAKLAGKKVVTILCGANMDFHQLASISHAAGVGSSTERYFRFHIKEEPGELLRLLEQGLEGLNIIDFQYGKNHKHNSWPILGVGGDPAVLEKLPTHLKSLETEYEDVTSCSDVTFRIIPYKAHIIAHPYFIQLEFPERPGALHDFLKSVEASANICYFNYQYTGERVGRALIGFEFRSELEKANFRAGMKTDHWQFRAFEEVSPETLSRIVG